MLVGRAQTGAGEKRLLSTEIWEESPPPHQGGSLFIEHGSVGTGEGLQ